jgi:hypothetical protein
MNWVEARPLLATPLAKRLRTRTTTSEAWLRRCSSRKACSGSPSRWTGSQSPSLMALVPPAFSTSTVPIVNFSSIMAVSIASKSAR